MNDLVETLSGLMRAGRHRRSPDLGRAGKDIYVFKGIPYAKAPVGDLRFAPPVEPNSWTGVRETNKFSPVSMQNSSSVDRLIGSKPPEMSEDCLTLNVWTPGLDDEKRPVMVWIHGGSFLSGSGRAPWYDGTSFADQGDVVIVTINYRLGPLGFLYLAEFGEEFTTSGNLGLLDQIASLRWVKENISSFGGNPDNVTVFGESAGAMSIGALLVSPLAKGLFHKVIMQSGACDNIIDSDEASRVTRQLLDALGLDKDKHIPEKLREIPTHALLEAQAGVRMLHMQTGMPWRPVIDEAVITEAANKTIDSGNHSVVPLLIGTNLDEARFFTVFDPATNQLTDETLIERCNKRFGDGIGKTLLERYRNDRPELSAPQVWAAIETDRLFRVPVIDLAVRHSRRQSETYAYFFTWPSPAFAGLLGSCHVLEIPFVFNNLSQPGVKEFCGAPTSGMQELADNMHNAWAAFAHSGNPGHAEIPNWLPYSSENQTSMVFNETCIADPYLDAKPRLLLDELTDLEMRRI